jgi:hypothetical protein
VRLNYCGFDLTEKTEPAFSEGQGQSTCFDDRAGNRLAKEDVFASKDVTYTYVVSSPATYGSCSNRLAESRQEVPNEHRRK